MLSPSSGGSSRSKIRSRKCLDYFQDTTLISDFCGAEITAILRAASERGLPSLLIGANAIVLLGYIRNTVDLDLLVPEQSRLQWLDLLRELGYRVFHGIEAFAQFEPADKTGAPVDLMFVEEATWEKL